MSDNNFRKGPHAAKNKPSSSDIEILDPEVIPASDERKTVVVDEDLDGVEFDDKVWLYWKRNKNTIISYVVILFAVVIGTQSYKLYKESAEKSLANAYAAAQNQEQLNDFADANNGTALAGVANIQNADALFADEDFVEAKKVYDIAAKNLAGTTLEGRALLGSAVSLVSIDSQNGLSALQDVSDNTSIDPIYQAQATYILGLTQANLGKNIEAKKTLDLVVNNPKAGYFSILSQEYINNNF